MNKPLVILESPFAGDTARNIRYAIRAMYDSILNHGEAPLAFHLLYPQILNDDIPEERQLGLNLSKLWYHKADRVVAYIDYGISCGMKQGLIHAEAIGFTPIYRSIGQNPANDDNTIGRA